jgi:tetratricopeptide (TPR) repeat protein
MKSTQPSHAARRLSATCTRYLTLGSFCLVSCQLFAAEPAEPEAAPPQMSQLLFEPQPLPADAAAPDVSFVSLDSVVAGSRDGNGAGGGDALGEDALRASIEEYVARIGDKEATEGPYSDQLTQDLLSTGQIYQQLGEHEQALDFFTRAQNISRANHGIEDIDQAPIMEAMTQSHLALDQLTEADAAQDGLLDLYKRAYGESSAAIVPAVQRLGAWNLNAFLDRSNVMLNIKRINMASFLATTGYDVRNLGGGNIRRTAGTGAAYVQEDNPTKSPVFKLFLAQGHFQNAINLLLQAKDYANPQLLDLERQLITTLFLHTHQENIVYEPDFYLSRRTRATGTRVDTSAQNLLNSADYDAGVESLRRSLTYIVNNEQRTAEQVARAMLEAGDWEVLFVRGRRADEKYAEAYDFFSANPEVTATISDLVYPELPVVLPVFLPAPNSREKLGIGPDEAVQYFGYFDVSFSIGSNGKARRIKTLGQGGEVTRDMKDRLDDYLKNLVFRPRYKDGKFSDDELRLRYFVGY